jgi:hypothetical protein
MKRRFIGDVRGLEEGSKFYALRYVGRSAAHPQGGVSRAPYIVTRRGEDFVEAEDTAAIALDEDVKMFDVHGQGYELRLVPVRVRPE